MVALFERNDRPASHMIDIPVIATQGIGLVECLLVRPPDRPHRFAKNRNHQPPRLRDRLRHKKNVVNVPRLPSRVECDCLADTQLLGARDDEGNS